MGNDETGRDVDRSSGCGSALSASSTPAGGAYGVCGSNSDLGSAGSAGDTGAPDTGAAEKGAPETGICSAGCGRTGSKRDCGVAVWLGGALIGGTSLAGGTLIGGVETWSAE
jgi:hypothetical protein